MLGFLLQFAYERVTSSPFAMAATVMMTAGSISDQARCSVRYDTTGILASLCYNEAVICIEGPPSLSMKPERLFSFQSAIYKWCFAGRHRASLSAQAVA